MNNLFRMKDCSGTTVTRVSSRTVQPHIPQQYLGNNILKRRVELSRTIPTIAKEYASYHALQPISSARNALPVSVSSHSHKNLALKTQVAINTTTN